MAKNPERHYETPDPTPVSIPSGFKRPETLEEQIRRLVRSARFADEVEAAGFETFEEADDFDVDDDPPEPGTPYEPFFDPALGREVTPADILRNRDGYARETVQRASRAQAAAERKKAAAATPPADPPPQTPPEPDKPAS